MRGSSLLSLIALLTLLAACQTQQRSLQAPFSYVSDKNDNEYRAYVLDAVNLLRDMPAYSERDWDPVAVAWTINGLRLIPRPAVREACRIYLEDGGKNRPYSGEFAKVDEGLYFKVAVVLTLAFPDLSRGYDKLREALHVPSPELDAAPLVRECPTFPILMRNGLPFLLYYPLTFEALSGQPLGYLDTDFERMEVPAALEPGTNPVGMIEGYLESDGWSRLAHAYASPFYVNRTRTYLRMQAARCVRNVVPAADELLRRARADATLNAANVVWQPLVEACSANPPLWDSTGQHYFIKGQ